MAAFDSLSGVMGRLLLGEKKKSTDYDIASGDAITPNRPSPPSFVTNGSTNIYPRGYNMMRTGYSYVKG